MTKIPSVDHDLGPTLRSVFESIRDSIAVLDRGLIIVEANQVLIDGFKSNRAKVIGHPIADFFPADVAQFRLSNYRQVFAEEVTLEFESERLGIWYHSKITPIFDESGSVTHISIVARDVTDRKNAEDKLRDSHRNLEKRVLERTKELEQSESKLRDFALSAVDSYWELDADFTIVYSSSNQPGWNIRGGKGIVGKKINEIYMQFANDLDWQEFFDALETHAAFRDIVMPDYSDDGVLFFLRRSAAPIFDVNGEFAGYRGTTTNVTKDVLAHEQAKSLEKLFYDAIDNMSEGFLLWDANSRLIQCNEFFKNQMPREIRKILKPGLWFGDFMRRRAEIGKFENAIGRMDEWVAEVVSEHGKFPLMTFRDKIRQDRWIEIRVNRLDNGSILEFYRDVTALKQVEIALKEKSESEELLRKISFASNKANSVEEAYQACIDEVCDFTGWPVGHIWDVRDNLPHQITSSGIWHVNEPEKYRKLMEHSFYSKSEIENSLIFKVIKSGQTYWTGDVSTELQRVRGKIIHDSGGKGVVLSPLKRGSEVFAVLEFIVEGWSDKDAVLKSALSQIELQISHVIDRERVKAEIRIGEERFRDFAGSLADRFWETDENFKYIFVTPASGNLSFNEDRIVGNAPWEIEGADHSADWEHLRADFEARVPFRDFRYSWFDDEGVVHPLKVSGKPYFDPNGNFLGYRGTTIDETSIVEARAQAEDIKYQFYHAMENLDAGFSLWDADHRFIMCNSTYLSIQPEGQEFLKVGVNYTDYIRNLAKEGGRRFEGLDIQRWVKGRLRDYKEPGRIFEYQLEDGRWFRVNKQRMENGNTISFHFEITDLKKREVELGKAIQDAEAANKTKSEFLANMSHELRTPLNAIIGFSDALKHGVFGELANTSQLDYLTNIHEAGNHLLELINEVLDVSAIEAGHFELKEEDVWLTEVTNSALRLVDQRAHVGGVIVENFLDKFNAVLHADELRLKQILLNLLSNAVKFTPSGGHVSLGLSKCSDGTVDIIITDTGIGMDADGVKKAMITFGQVENYLSREKEGTGLGIPLTKRLVEAHGGSLGITSLIGEGTTVIVKFPKERLISIDP